jgi:hypothetical protein
MNSHINNNTTTPNYLQIMETLPSYTNGNFTYLDNNYAYIIFNSNGSIQFKENTPCNLLLVGAGGRGGKKSTFGGAGGGGGGEIQILTNQILSSNIYNINIGIDSDIIDDRITKIISNDEDIYKALGGGDGGYWDGSSSGEIQRFPPIPFTSNSPIMKTTYNNNPCYKSTIYVNSNYYEVFYSSKNSYDAINLFNCSDIPSSNIQTVFADNQYIPTGTNNFNYKSSNFLSENNYKGDWVFIKLPIPIYLTSYSFVQNITHTGASPNNFKIYGSIDGINWTIIKERKSNVSLSYTNYIYNENISSINPYLYYGLVVNSVLSAGFSYLKFNQWILYGKPLFLTSPTLNGGLSVFELPSNQIQGKNGKVWIYGNNIDVELTLIKTIKNTSSIDIPFDNHIFKINKNPLNTYINTGTYLASFNEGFITFANEIYPSYPILTSIQPEHWFKFNSPDFNDNLIISGEIINNTYDIYFNYGAYLTPTINQLWNSNGISISFWIKPEISIGDYLWIFKTIENSNEFISFHQNQFKICNNGIITSVNFNNNILDGFFHHFVCSINPSGKIIVACDGTIFENNSSSPFINNSYINGRIGEFFQGYMKDFRIYLKFLDNYEIQELFKGRIDFFYYRGDEYYITDTTILNSKTNYLKINTSSSNIQVGAGGIGGTSSSIPTIKTYYGDGGDGNDGLGYKGIVIITFPYPNLQSILTPYKFPSSQFLKFSGLNNPTGIQFKLLENKTNNRLLSIDNLCFKISSNNPYIYTTSNININNSLFINSNGNIGFGTNIGINNSFSINDFTIKNYNSNISFINSSGFYGIGTTNPLNFLDIRNNISISKLDIGSFNNSNSNLNIYGNSIISGDANIGNLILNGTIYKNNGIPYIDSGWTNMNDDISSIYNSYSIVGIGTTFPKFQNRLDVYGTIKCNEVFVNGAILTNDFITNSGTTADTIQTGTLRISAGGTNCNSFLSNQILNSTIEWSNNSLTIFGNFNNSNFGNEKLVLSNGIKIGNCLIDKYGISNSNIIINSNFFIKSNIGIGTTNPLNLLDIRGNFSIRRNLISSNISNNEILNGVIMNVSNISIEGTINKYLSRWSNSNNFLGFVGIGTTNPQNSLDINGNMKINGILNSSNISNNQILNGIILNVSNIYNENLVINYKNNNNFIGSRWNLSNSSLIYNTGFIGIGTTVLDSNLNINGNFGIKGILNMNNSNISNINWFNGKTLNISNLRFLTNSSGIISFINGNTLNLNNWTTDNNKVYYNYGNVGIKTSINQSNSIDINGDLNFNSNISNLNKQIFNFENYSGSISTNQSLSSPVNIINNSFNSAFGYYKFIVNDNITINRDLICDVLIVGAGGNGGSGVYSGGGGAGEVIYHPNYQFKKGSYNLTVGLNSTDINNRISKITNGTIDVFKALGGGDGNVFFSIVSVSGTGYSINISSDDNNYRYIFFGINGTLTIEKDLLCDILIIGGGGGGGFDGSGGGGGGQVLYYTNDTVSFKSGSSLTLNAGSYNINIGLGGIGSTKSASVSELQAQSINGTDGGTSSIVNSLTSTTILSAVGGGGGASRNNNISGGNIGGGGGAGHAASDKNIYSTSTNNGGRGGKSHPSSYGGGGGGGGANTSGTLKDGGDANAIANQYGGNGGTGVNINITGTAIGYGGGGGGGSWYGAGGTASHGGGNGNITNATTAASVGTANTGGGGGSGGNAGTGDPSGKNGGTGVVIIRYKNFFSNSYSILKDGSGNIINPTIWYKFDINTNIGKDEFNAYNLTNNNTVTTTTGIKGTYACSFNATNYLSIANGISFTGNNFSISYWQYAKSNLKGFSASFGTDNVMNGSVMVGYGINFENKYFFGFWGNDVYSPEFIYDVNKWVFITYTYNVTTKTRKIYRNGIIIVTDTASNQLSQSGTKIHIGKYGNGYDANGNCDDFRVYNGIELTQSQVTDLFNGNLNNYNQSFNTNGSGGGSYLNSNNQSLAITKWNNIYSYVSSGTNGTSSKGGDGGSSLITSTYNLTGTNELIAIGGTGATLTSSPVSKTTKGSGGDGNGGSGVSGLIIIKILKDLRNFNLVRNYLFNNGDYSILKDLNPIVWYKFDDNTNIGLDSSGNGYNLINNLGTLENINIKKGNGSIYLNNPTTSSTKQYFQIASLPATYLNSLNLANGISLSFWIKLSSSSIDYCRILYFGNYQASPSFYDNTNYRIQIRTTEPKTSAIFFDIIKDGFYTFQYNSNIFDNTWKHIIWTISPSGIWNIYINNIKICDNQLQTVIPSFLTTNLNYLFGMDNHSDNYGITGNFDDIRIYNIVLSSNQVQELYENSKINFIINGNSISKGINYISSMTDYPLLIFNSNFNYSSYSSNFNHPFIITSNSNIEILSYSNNFSNSILLQSNIYFNINNSNKFTINSNISTIINSLDIKGNSGTITNQGGAYFSILSGAYNQFYAPEYTNFSLRTFDNIICGKNSYALSDRRIKNNISNIDDETSLNKILKIEPKIYGYIDNIRRTNSNVYGFIAQQVREVLPEATELTSKYIPNIFKLGKINGNRINLNEEDLNKINIGDEIEIYTKNNSYEVKIIAKDNSGINIDKIIEENDIFIYGIKVKDFHIIDKSYLYTLNICATQELARIIEGLKERINNL